MLEKSDIKEIVDQVQGALEPRFAQIDTRLDGIDGRLDGMDGRLDGMDRRLDGMDGKIEGIDGRLSNVETELRKTRIDIENRILPVINDMNEVYKTTFHRYIESTEKIDRIEMEQEVLKGIVADHTEQLEKLHAS